MDAPTSKAREFRINLMDALQRRVTGDALPDGFKPDNWLWQCFPKRTWALEFLALRTLVALALCVVLWGHGWAVAAVLALHFLPTLYQLTRMTVSRTFGSNVMMPVVFLGMMLVALAQKAVQFGLLIGGAALLLLAEGIWWQALGLLMIYGFLMDLEVDRWFRARQHFNPEIQKGFSRRPLSRAIAQSAVAHPAPKVLDVACGDGSSFLAHISDAIAEAGGQTVGVDSNPNGIAAGRAKFPGLDLHVGDAVALPFEDESFDVVTSFGGVNQQAMGSKALAELFRVCKTGGTVFLLDEQLARGSSWIERQHFYRTITSTSSNSWMLDEAPVNYLPPEAGNLRVVQAGSSYYILRADKMKRDISVATAAPEALRA
ncbi:class I SAM-dependent methyltransferase [Cognatishimia sp. F0-27]|uniref:class I SAM-dependent methyltransferase n=1 Tax=Cognatishimia sp. F0-27 TaxID=2816855 RepID=UPI001D0C0A96|nr:class I SAM-dependent methyltransferase [Cognatishimia sp. F0-27]MCC1493272.1 class I SAM-dependent methyltransferase [Cognatishimia sp. F0-27]